MLNFGEKTKDLIKQNLVKVEVYTIKLTDGTLYSFTDNSGDVVVNGVTYSAIPIKRTRIKQNEGQVINSTSIQIGDSGFVLSKIVIDNVNLIKRAVVTISRGYVDPEINSLKEAGWQTLFRGVVVNAMALTGILTLTVPERYHDWSRPLNTRRFGKFCNWVFKDTNCTYTGLEIFCDKTFPQCELYANTDNFGGFENVPLLHKRLSLQ